MYEVEDLDTERRKRFNLECVSDFSGFEVGVVYETFTGTKVLVTDATPERISFRNIKHRTVFHADVRTQPISWYACRKVGLYTPEAEPRRDSDSVLNTNESVDTVIDIMRKCFIAGVTSFADVSDHVRRQHPGVGTSTLRTQFYKARKENDENPPAVITGEDIIEPSFESEQVETPDDEPEADSEQLFKCDCKTCGAMFVKRFTTQDAAAQPQLHDHIQGHTCPMCE